jgi:glycosyltransferase involved in cell wall biosynthesis
MTDAPLVTVICLCYNHERFLEEAVLSALQQTYPRIQIIIVDDASTDNSAHVIANLLKRYPTIESYRLPKNVGNCRAFNVGLSHARGEFIIDLATDDVMLPDRVERQIEQFQTLDESYGVVFSDAEYISENGKFVRNHFGYLFDKRLLTGVPQGNIYREVLSTFFIPPPTMMVRKKVFDLLDGYDENLAYEDFDFWVRSSRNFKYGFLDIITTRIRISQTSLSKQLYRKGDKQLHSTYLVCEKAAALNRTEEENESLAKRVTYELRHSVFSDNKEEAKLFSALLEKLGKFDWTSAALTRLNNVGLPLAPLRNFYHRIRYGK